MEEAVRLDTRYEQFCLTDPIFYDSPMQSDTQSERFADGRELPEGWVIHQQDVWTMLAAPDAALPPQGWKIHVSATLGNANDLLDAVWSYCVPRGISFKFLANLTTLLLRNAKYADRPGSGKFITIYPVVSDVLETTLDELDAGLAGADGPYILSDVRWNAGPLYVRYGGFAERYCRVGGELALAVAEPSGQLVPDKRGSGFYLPDWVEVPEFLKKCIADRMNPDTPHDFPFKIERALHHSNGGGVYLATDTRTGDRVVLKEARPHAGLDAHGHDAIRRLDREREFLEKLNGSGVTPDLYGTFTCWEHQFLVEEYIEGETLAQAYVARFPLIHPDVTDEQIAEYAQWTVSVIDKIEDSIQVLHRTGIVFGDLHPHNILVRPDGEVRFIDIELASHAADGMPSALGAPGYAAPDGRGGVDADLYALACLRFGLFLPLTAVLPFDPAKAELLAESITGRFSVRPDFFTDAIKVLRDRRSPITTGSRAAQLASDLDSGGLIWPELRDSIRDGILASATPQRSDRLFPGDIEQFSYNGLGLAYGAAGVLYALARVGAGQYPEHEQWLVDAVKRDKDTRCVGLYDGLHGIAYTLAELGRPEDALRVLDRAMAAPLDHLSTGLFGGLAGIGLNLLYFAELTGDRAFLTQAVDIGERLASGSTAADPVTRSGLMHGPSGQALLHIRLFEATGDDRQLARAETKIAQDLDQCVPVPDGTIQMNEGWRVMPYVATGSAGTGLAIHELLRHREHEEFTIALTGIRRAAEPEFIICPGLFNGRAGLLAFLIRLFTSDPSAAAQLRPVIDRHLRRLSWHVVSYQGFAAFPGDQLMRLSMDLATGSAGVLLALNDASGGRPAAFPW
jgi:serine/threonine protein kinase